MLLTDPKKLNMVNFLKNLFIDKKIW